MRMTKFSNIKKKKLKNVSYIFNYKKIYYRSHELKAPGKGFASKKDQEREALARRLPSRTIGTSNLL